MSDGILPAGFGESIECVMFGNPIIDLRQGKDTFCIGQDSLCDHCGI